jgi:hypothetical protein
MVRYVIEYLLKISYLKGLITQEEMNNIIEHNATVIISSNEMKRRLAEHNNNKEYVAFESYTSGLENLSELVTRHMYNTDSTMSSHRSFVGDVLFKNTTMSLETREHKYKQMINMHPDQVCEMMYNGVPISYTYNNKHYLSLITSDLWYRTYKNNLHNYLLSISPSIDINITTFIDTWNISDAISFSWFLSLMKELPNKFIGHAHGMLGSSASIILLHCDELELSKYSLFKFVNMFHYERDGKDTSIHDAIYANLINKGLLLQEEVDKLNKVMDSNKSVYVSGEEMQKRWKKYKLS